LDNNITLAPRSCHFMGINNSIDVNKQAPYNGISKITIGLLTTILELKEV